MQVAAVHHPVHDRFHALPNPCGRFWLGGPYGLQHFQHVYRGNFVDRHIPNDRVDVGCHGAFPLGGVLGVAPSGAAQVYNGSRGLGEGGNGRGWVTSGILGFPILGQGIPAFGDGGAVVGRQNTGLGHADGRVGAQADVPALIVDYDALDPGLGAGGGATWR